MKGGNQEGGEGDELNIISGLQPNWEMERKIEPISILMWPANGEQEDNRMA